MEIKVGEIIKARREEKGYNLQEFAGKIDISPGYLSQIENGRKTNPRLDIILRIIHELDIDIDMLLGLESGEETYLSRIPSLLKLVLAKERNLRALSETDIQKKFAAFIDKLCESKYIFEDKVFYSLFLDDVFNQTENTLKRYMALKLLFSQEQKNDNFS